MPKFTVEIDQQTFDRLAAMASLERMEPAEVIAATAIQVHVAKAYPRFERAIKTSQLGLQSPPPRRKR